MKNLVLLAIFAMMAFGVKAQDSTKLNQQFDVDDSSGIGGDHFPPGWSVYHVIDNGQVWKHYGLYGVNNSPCLEFNGYQGGADHPNDAWLIAPKLNLNGYTTIYLNFSAVYLYVGDSLHVKVSTNYSGTGSPAASGVTWTEPPHTGVMLDDSNSVSLFRNFQVNLTPYISSHTYVAIEYISSDISGSRWSLDSVVTSGILNHVGINNVADQKFDINVVGNGTSDKITIGYNLNEGNYEVSVYDLVGRKLYAENIYAQAGYQTYTLNSLNLASGMYIVRLGNESSFGSAKAMVR